MKNTSILVAGFMLLLPAASSAQIEIEARAGSAIGSHTETLAGLEMLPRPAFDLLLKRRFGSEYRLFAGGSFASFGCNNGWCRNLTIEALHVVAGVEGRFFRYLWARTGGGYGSTTIRSQASYGPIAYGALGGSFDLGPVTVLPGGSVRWMHAGDGEYALSMSADIGLAYTYDWR